MTPQEIADKYSLEEIQWAIAILEAQDANETSKKHNIDLSKYDNEVLESTLSVLEQNQQLSDKGKKSLAFIATHKDLLGNDEIRLLGDAGIKGLTQNQEKMLNEQLPDELKTFRKYLAYEKKNEAKPKWMGKEL